MSLVSLYKCDCSESISALKKENQIMRDALGKLQDRISNLSMALALRTGRKVMPVEEESKT